MYTSRITMQEISLDQHADMVEVSTALTSVDLGGALVADFAHPTLGRVILVNTAGGRCACIAIP